MPRGNMKHNSMLVNNGFLTNYLTDLTFEGFSFNFFTKIEQIFKKLKEFQDRLMEFSKKNQGFANSSWFSVRKNVQKEPA